MPILTTFTEYSTGSSSKSNPRQTHRGHPKKEEGKRSLFADDLFIENHTPPKTVKTNQQI